MKVPEKCRVLVGRMASDKSYGCNGAFDLTEFFEGRVTYAVVSDGGGWEHVSVRHVLPDGVLNWQDMCTVKDLFWDPEECVMQLHPPASSYVNCHPCVLHLWRPTREKIPQPPTWMVGPK